MDLAVRTSASPAAIWAICVVAVACLVFWLGMIMYADSHPYVRHRRVPRIQGSVMGGTHLAAGGRSVAPTRDAQAVASGDFFMGLAGERLAGPRRQEQPAAGAQEPAAQEPAAQEPAAQEPARPDTGVPWVPGPRGPQAPAEPGAAPARQGAAGEAQTQPIPVQRTGTGGTAPADTGPADTGPADTGPADTGQTDTAPADTGPPAERRR